MNASNNAEIIEEDWSSFMGNGHGNGNGNENGNGNGNNSDDEKNTNSFLTGFAQHHEVVIQLSTSSSSSTSSASTSATTIVNNHTHVNAYSNTTTNTDTNTNTDTATTTTNIATTAIMMKLHCVEALTPLDMMNLSNGQHDSTGHRVWMGALFFIESFACPLPFILETGSVNNANTTNTTNNANATNVSTMNTATNNTTDNVHNNEYEYKQHKQKQHKQHNKMIQLLSYWRSTLFHEKHIIELGSGTGASGISIMIAASTGMSTSTSTSTSPNPTPTSIIFTDSDPSVLQLCKKNIIRNLPSSSYEYSSIAHSPIAYSPIAYSPISHSPISHSVCNLEWGNDDIFTECNMNTRSMSTSNDEKSHADTSIDTNTDTDTDTNTNTNNDTKLLIPSIPSITSLQKNSQDTVIATDVIYDISALKPLFQTVTSVIKPNGYFVLSHIPRAYVEEDVEVEFEHDHGCDSGSNSDRTRNVIERLILKEAELCGFVNVNFWSGIDDDDDDDNNDNNNKTKGNTDNPHTSNDNNDNDECCIRPRDLAKMRKKMITSKELDYEEMDLVGAGIFIFRYKPTHI